VPYSKYKITIEQTSRISLKNKKGYRFQCQLKYFVNCEIIKKEFFLENIKISDN